jgi:hypothetical protein
MKERSEQGEEIEVRRAVKVEFLFSETFEVVKVGGE